LQNYYLRPDLINAKTNSNSTYAAWNISNSTPVTVPFSASDSTISSLNFVVPTICYPFTNIIYDCYNTSYFNVTSNVSYVQNSTTTYETTSAGYYTLNESITHLYNANNSNLKINIGSSTFLNAQYKGTLSLITNNSGSVTVSYNSTSINIYEDGINNYTNYLYNVTIPYNNPPQVSVSNQQFYDFQNVTVNFTATDSENTITCIGTLNGTVINNCLSPHDFGLMQVGQYTYFLNVSEAATVNATNMNKTAVITVSSNFISQFNNYTNDNSKMINNTIPNLPILYRINLYNESVNYSWYVDTILQTSNVSTLNYSFISVGIHNITVIATLQNSSLFWTTSWSVQTIDMLSIIYLKELEIQAKQLEQDGRIETAGVLGFAGGIVGGMLVVGYLRRKK